MNPNFSESNVDGHYDQEQVQTEPVSKSTTRRSFIIALALSSTLLLSAAALLYKNGNLSSISSLFGGNGGNSVTHMCPIGTYVTTIYASTGDYMDSMKIKCGDNAPLSKVGGHGGTERSRTCNNGFGAIRYHYGRFVGALSGQCVDEDNMEMIASAKYEKGQTALTTCPSGQVVSGFIARTGIYVDKVEFVCNVPEFGSTGGVSTTRSCPSSYISRMYGRQGHAVDRLGFACGDSFSDVGAVGGFGGVDVTNNCIGGFTSIKVIYGLYVSRIEAFCKSSSRFLSMGQGIFTQSFSSNGKLKCQSNQVLVSGKISIGPWNIVNRVSFTCGDFRPPTASPTLRPTASPPAPGFGSAGGFSTTLSCSSSYISRIHGRGGWAVDRLGFACGEKYTDAGAVGGFGGVAKADDCIGGFTSVKVTYGAYVSKIDAFCKSSNHHKSIGAGIYPDSFTHIGELKCHSNMALVSAVVSVGPHNIVNRVHFECGELKSPTALPSARPLAQPTAFPFAHPTSRPVAEPTDKPIARPTSKPISEPTDKPIAQPTDKPIAEPTDKPIAQPTDKPIAEPTDKPVALPTDQPIAEPTDKPVAHPTEKPVPLPTLSAVAEKSICRVDYFGSSVKVPDGCMVMSNSDLRLATASSPMKALLVCVRGEEPYFFSSQDAVHYGLVIKNKSHLSHLVLGDKIFVTGKPNPDIPGQSVLFKNFHSRTNYYLPAHHFDGGSAAQNNDRISSNDQIFSLEIKSTAAVLNSSC